MMNPFAAFIDELGDRGIRTRRFGKFDDTLANLERSDPDSLIVNFFVMDVFGTEQFPEELFGSGEIFYGDS